MSSSQNNEIIPQKLYSSEKSPLLRSYSSPETSSSKANNTNKHKILINHSSTSDNENSPGKPNKPEVCSNPRSVQFSNIIFNNGCDENPPADISAMSVVSLYQSAEDLETEMNTDEDFVDLPKPIPKLLIQQNTKSVECQNGEIMHHIETSKKMAPCNCQSKKCPRPTIFFRDGVRSVDFVLVWDAFEEDSVSPQASMKRQIFEMELLNDGLELEYEPQEPNGLNFIKIHAPKEVLRRYGEILKLRMPMKDIPALRQVSVRTNSVIDEINSGCEKIKSYIFVSKKKFPEKELRFTAIYSKDREYLFDVDSPCFFTPSIHSRIVQFILDRKRFSNDVTDDFAFGIERLLNDNIYSAAYPLHDGDIRTKGSVRNLLFTEWASVRKWYRYQPLDCVKEYFGVKIALYFAWLGFYTSILIPPAIVGLGCFIYSCATLYQNKPSEDICNLNMTERMCPLCDHWCKYWELKETCVHARITYLFDNATTVFFAIFMSFWATLFLEMWKRYSAEITHKWDLTGFDVKEEHPRPQYLARLAHVSRKQMNVITNTMEPQVPFWKIRVPMTIFSFSVVLLLVTLALATVVAVVLYRMSVLVALKVYSNQLDNSQAILITTSTAACINLIFILIFNWIYTYVAQYLTEFELLRTETEFDDSLTLKIYLLQFVNYYASIFYIALFKGKFIGSPQSYNKFLGYRQEECGPGGCLMELSIQLAIIMIGKQAMNTVLEMLFPLFFKWLNTLKVKTGISKDKLSCKGCQPQWFKDYKLVEWGPRGLFPEYLEMALQYGFVTIFVAAFPLAPFFALLNNILEMRLDAHKLLTFFRRPVSQRVKDIGVWYRILDSVGKLSVVTNAFIIAFTSDFIPRLVYIMTESPDGSLDGYLENSLSYFNISDFQSASRPNDSNYSLSMCRYPDYREHPLSENKYKRTSTYWIILASKLAFIVIFENIVVLVMIVVKWCIPDMSPALRDRIRKEAYVTNEIIIKQETLRACSQRDYSDSARKIEELRNINECPSTPEQWDRLLSKSLSGSEFDLLVHGNKGNLHSGPRSPTSV